MIWWPRECHCPLHAAAPSRVGTAEFERQLLGTITISGSLFISWSWIFCKCALTFSGGRRCPCPRILLEHRLVLPAFNNFPIFAPRNGEFLFVAPKRVQAGGAKVRSRALFRRRSVRRDHDAFAVFDNDLLIDVRIPVLALERPGG